jgi:hypothetical protein
MVCKTTDRNTGEAVVRGETAALKTTIRMLQEQMRTIQEESQTLKAESQTLKAALVANSIPIPEVPDNIAQVDGIPSPAHYYTNGYSGHNGTNGMNGTNGHNGTNGFHGQANGFGAPNGHHHTASNGSAADPSQDDLDILASQSMMIPMLPDPPPSRKQPGLKMVSLFLYKRTSTPQGCYSSVSRI